ncbi:hypothetical protein HanIR_Chr09g0407651 [Helianthus annuus]|nr:hypothetical protein HanIR_Chr09g0407651 [Helianthus annuus]
MTIRKNYINCARWHAIKHIAKDSQWKSGYTNEPDLPRFLQLLEGGNCLVYNLGTIANKLMSDCYIQ